MLEAEYKQRLVAKYGQAFADHAEAVLADIGAELYFHLCDYCGVAFPKGQGIAEGEREACCAEHDVLASEQERNFRR